MRFTWDKRKNDSNETKHGIRFEAAPHIFDDPFILTSLDAYASREERWQSLGMAKNLAVLFVVYTSHSYDDGEENIHIISLRKATSLERKIYEKARIRR